MEFSTETLPFGASLGKSLHLLVFLVENGVSGAGLLMEGMHETEFSLTCLLRTSDMDGAQKYQRNKT